MSNAKLYSTVIRLWMYIPFKKQILSLFRWTGLNFEKYVRDLWFEDTFKVRLEKNHFYLLANKIDKGMLEIFYKGINKSWDANSILIWSKLAARSRTAFDIGANFGLYAIAAKTTNANCTVYAFEPSIYGLQMLKENFKANDLSVETLELALSNKNGHVTFMDHKKSSAASSIAVNDTHDKSPNISRREVKC